MTKLILNKLKNALQFCTVVMNQCKVVYLKHLRFPQRTGIRNEIDEMGNHS